MSTRQRVIIILLAVMIIALGAGIYWKIRVAKLPIERITPEKPLLYAYLTNAAENWDGFRQSEFWSQIQEIDFGKLMAPLMGPAEFEELMGPAEFEEKVALEKKSEILDFLKGLGIRRFFGKELAIAIYPARHLETFSDLIPDIVLISRVEPDAKLITLIAKLYERLFDIKEITPEAYEYREHQISTISLEEIGFDLFYSYIRDLLVVSNSKECIKRSIDLSIDAKNSLGADEDFRYLASRMPGDMDGFSYFDARVLQASLKGLEPLMGKERVAPYPGAIEETTKGIDRYLEPIGMFKTIGVGISFGKPPTIKSLFRLDPTKIRPHLVKLYEFEPELNDTIDFVPEDTIFYYWMNLVDLRSYWEDLKYEISLASKEYGQDTLAFESFIEDFESDTGINIERDIIPLADNECAFLLSDIDVGVLFPIPKIALFIEIKDEDQTEEFLATYVKGLLAERANLQFKSETYSGRVIDYMVVPLGIDLQPCYSFLDRFLVISSSRSLLKELIDTFDGKYPSLAQSPGFREIDIGITGKNNSVSFLNIEISLEKARELAEWGFAVQDMALRTMSQVIGQRELSIDRLKLDFSAKESQIKDETTKLESIEREIQSKLAEGQDTAAEQIRLREIELDLAVKEKELAALKEEIATREKQLDEDRKTLEIQRRQFQVIKFFSEEIGYPMIEALKVLKEASSRQLIDKERIESATYINIAD